MGAMSSSPKACRPAARPVRILLEGLSAGILLGLLLGLLVAPPAGAQETTGAGVDGDRRLTVAIREVPPFAMRDDAGDWEGVSVDLWREVAERRGIEFDWREATLEQTLEGLENGELDVAIAALSVTGDREAQMDFSHPYYVTGLSLAFAAGGGSAWMATLGGFFSMEFLSAVGSLALVLLAAGFAIWLFERKANAEQFGHGDARRGLGDGFWWSAVTMTTVGYGDKAPKTVGGRVVALIWMFLSLIIIASFTASIAASLTTNELANSALRDRPLSALRVGVLRGSTAAGVAAARGARTVAYESVEASLRALEAGGIDTVFHDAPILRYRVRTSGVDAEVAERILVRDDYAFAFPEGSPQRNAINIALLSVLSEPTWQDIRLRYLGEMESAL